MQYQGQSKNITNIQNNKEFYFGYFNDKEHNLFLIGHSKCCHRENVYFVDTLETLVYTRYNTQYITGQLII